MVDRCVVCGDIIPEGRHVCVNCQKGNEAPCHKCKKRAMECHIYCQEYHDYYKARRKINVANHKRSKEDSYYIDLIKHNTK